MSQAVLMKEYKALAKEKWVQIDVSYRHPCLSWTRLSDADRRREYLPLEPGLDGPQPRLSILWRLL